MPDRRALVLEAARDIEETLRSEGLSMPPGFYVAFDHEPRIAYATAACDDDGDYVVVVSDALLLAAEYTARTSDDIAFVSAANRSPRARRMPVPPALVDAESRAAKDVHASYMETVHALVLREMAPLAARPTGDFPSPLRCAHPTLTHEAGDDTWTQGEQRNAWITGSMIHRSQEAARAVPLPPRLRALLAACANTVYFAALAAWSGISSGSLRP